MLRAEVEKYQHLILKIFVTALIALIIFYVGKFLLLYCLPFIIAFILSLILEPFVRFFQKLRLPRGVSVLLSMILFFGGLITLSTLAVARIAFELSKLYDSLPNYYNDLYNFGTQMVQKATDLYLQLTPEAVTILQNLLKTLFDRLTAILSSTATSIISDIKTLPGVAILLIITLIATFFLTKDKYIIRDFLFRQLPSSWGEKLASLKDNLFISLIGFLKAQLILLTITFTESFIGLTFLGMDYAFLIAIFVALVDILPVLGTGSVYVPWAIVNIALGNYRLALWLLGLYVFIIIVRYMIEPKIVGQQLGIHPVLALLSMFAGLKLIGVAGIILGPTIIVIIKGCQYAGILPRFK